MKIFNLQISGIENCTPKDQFENVLGFSDLELVPINDTDTFINGTLKINKIIQEPLRVVFDFKRYFRGQWVLELKKTYDNLCPDLHDPMSMVSFFTKYLPKCPMEAGVSFKIVNSHFYFFYIISVSCSLQLNLNSTSRVLYEDASWNLRWKMENSHEL